MERRPKVNQGQNRTREIWLSGIAGGACGNMLHGLLTICHEVGNDGYRGSYWPKTGVRHISISTTPSQRFGRGGMLGAAQKFKRSGRVK